MTGGRRPLAGGGDGQAEATGGRLAGGEAPATGCWLAVGWPAPSRNAETYITVGASSAKAGDLGAGSMSLVPPIGGEQGPRAASRSIFSQIL